MRVVSRGENCAALRSICENLGGRASSMSGMFCSVAVSVILSENVSRKKKCAKAKSKMRAGNEHPGRIRYGCVCEKAAGRLHRRSGDRSLRSAECIRCKHDGRLARAGRAAQHQGRARPEPGAQARLVAHRVGRGHDLRATTIIDTIRSNTHYAYSERSPPMP